MSNRGKKVLGMIMLEATAVGCSVVKKQDGTSESVKKVCEVGEAVTGTIAVGMALYLIANGKD